MTVGATPEIRMRRALSEGYPGHLIRCVVESAMIQVGWRKYCRSRASPNARNQTRNFRIARMVMLGDHGSLSASRQSVVGIQEVEVREAKDLRNLMIRRACLRLKSLHLHALVVVSS
jgi:hypothetical protein